MKTNEVKFINHTRRRLVIMTLIISAILTIPFVTEAPWTGFDYIFAGVVLFGCALVYEYSTRNMSSIYHKLAVAAGILLFIFTVIGWAAT